MLSCRWGIILMIVFLNLYTLTGSGKGVFPTIIYHSIQTGNNTCLQYQGIKRYINFQSNFSDISNFQTTVSFSEGRRTVFLNIFQYSEWIDFSILTGMLIIFWFFRRYEIRKFKNKNNLTPDSHIRIPDKNSGNFRYLNSKANRDACLTGKFGERDCFFLSENNVSRQREGNYPFLQHEEIKALLPKIDREVFCGQVCRGKNSRMNTTRNLVPSSYIFTSGFDLVPTNVSLKTHIKDNFFWKWKVLGLDLQKSHLSAWDQDFLQRTAEIVESNYTDYRFSVEQLAEKLNLSVSQINRKLNAITGFPSGYFIRLFRLKSAANMLLKETGSITDICFRNGFNDLAYFTRAFKKHFGCSPSVYRKIMIQKSRFVRQ